MVSQVMLEPAFHFSADKVSGLGFVFSAIFSLSAREHLI